MFGAVPLDAPNSTSCTVCVLWYPCTQYTNVCVCVYSVYEFTVFQLDVRAPVCSYVTVMCMGVYC